ncbi:sits-binding protein [Plakobranchus ocellatus]|uniref:Sits-binding protein n=1 Tax=Plakobranchus ocellatus TaxID=259542 RepID=A0AAV4C4M6_9GAST|nr:sits-binding protein [Plakobranchus ocellatus]
MAIRKRVVVMGACVFLMAGLIAGVGVYLWRQHEDRDDDPPLRALALGPDVNVYIMKGGHSVYLVVNSFPAADRYKELGSELGITAKGRASPCTSSAPSGAALCVQWEDGAKLHITVASKTSPDLDCITMSWNVSQKRQQTNETPTDCYDMSHSFWYGAFEDHFQKWPMNTLKIGASPYVTGEIFDRVEYGEVIEPLFLSSLGMGIHADVNTPLYLGINAEASEGRICLTGRTGSNTPYLTQTIPSLRYDLCKAKDISTLWKEMAKKYLPKPRRTPSPYVVKFPIWSTWARYKSHINQTKVLDFAEQILRHNMTISQLEIDDDWTPRYGDFTFSTEKFPEPAAMVNELLGMRIHTTLWMHPFINTDSDAYKTASREGYLVCESANSPKPAAIDWWRGNGSGLIDFTNDKAVDWYLQELKKLQTNFNVSSFKFDAGEVSYLPKRYALASPLTSPNFFTTRYVDAACRSDMFERRLEVRVGFRSQECHALVRMLDRASDWTHKLGILTLIPTALVSGLAGYPFVLPDMIGGNAYNASNIDQTVLPDRELYLRWLQVTLFMPTLQFSVAPWDYDEETVKITQKLLSLREDYIDDILLLMDHARDTGEPVVRPLWWTDPLDKDALTCETEFLLGNDLLVAPVLEKGATSRDIYLPQGLWHDQLRGIIRYGKQWLRDYTAQLDELPHFARVDDQGIVG